MAVTVVKLCPTRDLLAYGTNDGHVRIEKITRPMVSLYSPCNLYITIVLRYMLRLGGGEFPLSLKCVYIVCAQPLNLYPPTFAFAPPLPPLQA